MSNPYLEDAPTVAESNPYLEDAVDSGQGRLASAGNAFMQGGGVAVGQTSQGLARLMDILAPGALMQEGMTDEAMRMLSRTGKQREADIAKNPLYSGGGALAEGAKEAYPTNPKFKGEFWTDTIPSSAGAMVPTIAAAGVGGVLAGGLQYGTSAGQSEAQAAIDAGREDEADKAFLINLGIGATSEALLGVGANIFRLVRAARTAKVGEQTAKAIIGKAIAKGSTREALQEGFEQVGQNAAAGMTYDPERGIWVGVPTAMAAGALLGGAGGGGASVVGVGEQALNERAAERDFASQSESVANRKALEATIPSGAAVVTPESDANVDTMRGIERTFNASRSNPYMADEPLSQSQAPSSPDVQPGLTEQPSGTVSATSPVPGASLVNLVEVNKANFEKWRGRQIPFLVDSDGKVFVSPGSVAHWDIADEAPDKQWSGAGFIKGGRLEMSSDYFPQSKDGETHIESFNKTVADKQSQVRAELEALPGAEQDLAQPKTAVASELESMLKATEAKRTVSPLTSEQTDAGLLDDSRPDEATPTLGDLRAMIAEIKGNQLAPKASEPTVPVAEKAVPPTNPGGSQSALPAAQQAISKANNSIQAFAKANGVEYVEGDTQKTIFEKIKAQSSAPQGTGTAAGQINPPVVGDASPSPVSPKWTPTAGKLAVVNLTSRGAGRLARVLQVQPDGDATVQIKGEAGTRYVKLSQMRPTGAEQSRMNRADEMTGLDPADVESVKRDAAEFDQLVEDYAPQLEWAPGEAYSDTAQGTELRADAIERGELRKAARVNAARAAGVESFQESSLVDRAEALPKLEAYLRQQFPGDNSIDQRRVLEDFSRSEAEPTTTPEQQSADAKALRWVIAQHPGWRELQGLTVHKQGRAAGTRATVGGQPTQQATRGRVVGAAEQKAIRELDRINGTRTILVDSPDLAGWIPFNGVRIANSNIILIHARTAHPLAVVYGHELSHYIEATHPGLYREALDYIKQQYQNTEKFRQVLRSRQQGTDNATLDRELFADFTGDLFTDPQFLEEMAKREPNLFKRLARIIKTWLDKLLAKIKTVPGYESAQYFKDVTSARDVVADMLIRFAREQQFEAKGVPGREAAEADQFSKPTTDPGFSFDAPESVSEQKTRQAVEKRKADEARAKQSMQERAGAKLTGADVDTTKEMFGAEVKQDKAGQGSLFSKPSLGANGVLDDPSQSSGQEWWLNPSGKYHSAPRGHDAKANQLLNRDADGIKPGQNSSMALMDKGYFRVVRDWVGKTVHAEGLKLNQSQVAALERLGIARDYKVVAYDRTGSYPRKIYSPPEEALFSKPERGPLWRSNIQDALATWQNKGTAEQLRAHLAKTKGAMDEAEWIGLDEFLKDKPSVTKQQVAEFVKANTVDVQEVTKGAPARTEENTMKTLNERAQLEFDEDYDSLEGDQQQEIQDLVENDGGVTETKFSQYQLPGGENYRELLLTLPETQAQALDYLPTGYRVEERPETYRRPGALWQVVNEDGGAISIGQTKDEAFLKAMSLINKDRKTSAQDTRFKSTHFDEPNILAHVRFNERTDADGKRVLFIEEVQSDWHQKGRKEGYADKPFYRVMSGTGTTVLKQGGEGQAVFSTKAEAEAYAEKGRTVGWHVKEISAPGVPNAPFKTTWPMLAMRRMIRYAVDNGFDRLAWTTGEQQNERYDLSKQVDSIDYGTPDGQDYTLAIYKSGIEIGESMGVPDTIPAKDLEKYVGKDVARRITEGVKTGTLKGDDLKVGGKPMRKFYDEMLPSEVNKFVKKWGGRVGQTKIPAGDKRTFRGTGELAAVRGRIEEIRTAWESPTRTAADWQRWNTSLDAQATDVTDAMQQGLPYDEAMRRHGSPSLAALLGGDFGKAPHTEQVHSLDITPAMQEAAMQGMPLFSKPEQSKEFAQLQSDIATAQTELMDAIRQHMNPPEGMRKAEALEAKDAASSKLRGLLAKQLKLMTSATVDAARSPEQTAEMISQTVDLLNSIQDDISERNAKSQEVPADLTKLRQDLQTRLNLLKGWSDDQTDLEARGVKPERVNPEARTRFRELESATDADSKTVGEFWQKIKTALRYLTSPIPELPLTGERAEKSALFRRGYRLFAVENNAVRKAAAEKINAVVEPLTKLGRKPADNAKLQQYYRLGTALQRAKMDPAKTKLIEAKMAELETELNKDPFNLFRRLVLYRDLWWRGTFLKNEQGEPITLPMGLTVDDVAGELRKLTKAITEHPDGLAITEALRRHYALTEELQKSILAHGEIIPESLRNPLYFPHHVIDSWSGNIARVRPSTEEDFRKYLITPTGSGKLIQTDYLKAMYLHTADVLAHNSRVELVDKYWKPYDISEELKKQHGADWNKPWNVPPGYKLFTPFKKLPLRMDYILSREVLAEKLGVLFNDGDLRTQMAGKVLNVKPEDLHAAMVAGEKIQWALPEEIADALNGIAKRESAATNPGLGHAIGLPFRIMNNFWKKTKLFAPWNWIRYEYGNLSTDAVDKVLAADPVTAKYLSRAARELWNADTDEQSPEFKAAAREGVFDTITAGEAGELTKLPQFKAFLTPGELRMENIRHALSTPMRGSKFREGVFRYAKFLADVERLRAGKQPVYAGAFHGDIEALGEDVDGQRKLLEGDELIYAKAAEISLKTYGDYNSLGVAGQWLRTYAVPFWSWQDVNFRYHANQLRNIADGIRGVKGATSRHAALRYAGVRVVTTLIAVGIAKELWNQFGGVALGLWDDDDDLEASLSEADRRRGHILIGKDAKGQAMVVYTPSALSDVAEWTGGQNMKRLFMEYARGQITLNQFISDYAKQLPKDVVNKLAQSVGPLGKAPYELASNKATFPDILDQRTIPDSDRWWRLVGTLTDDRAVNVLRSAFDQDYYSQPAAEQLQQIILQVRRRDPEQWAYFEAREDASDWKEAKTGKRFEFGSYNAPEAQALRNFRKSIYRGDVANAERFYASLLDYGYTAERLDASIRNQHPLSDLNVAERAEYTKALTDRQKRELELATKYYSRIKAMDTRERDLFKSKKYPDQKPNPALLKRIVEEQRR